MRAAASWSRPAAGSGWRPSMSRTAGWWAPEFYEAKLVWLDHLTSGSSRRERPSVPLALCGDFNVAPTDNDVWDPAAVHGATHVSPPERERVARMRGLGADRHPAAVPLRSRATSRGGTTGRALPQELRDADRPRPGDRATRRAGPFRRARPRCPQAEHLPGIPSDHAPVVVDFMTPLTARLEDDDRDVPGRALLVVAVLGRASTNRVRRRRIRPVRPAGAWTWAAISCPPRPRCRDARSGCSHHDGSSARPAFEATTTRFGPSSR